VLSNRTLGEHAYNALKDWIITGRLAPGDRLMYDQLTKELGISQSPLKEAFLRLEREGLVVINPRRGTFVKQLSLAEVEELYQIREALEGLSARLASQNASEEDIRTLRRHCTELEEGLRDNDPDKCLEADFAFHDLVVRAACNERLASLIHAHVLTNLFAITGRRSYYVHIGTEALTGHRKVIDAIEAGDEDAAERTMRLQIRSGAESIRAALAEAGDNGEDI
jgi:DNA-binding GntR family transcriptional regulator